MGEYITKNGIRIPKKYEWVDLSSPSFREAVESVTDSDYPILSITGPGGSGKSIIYKMAYEMNPERTICAASTGVAAFNLSVDGVPAVTLHSALRLKPTSWFDPNKVIQHEVMRLMNADTLLIDEVSMLSANTIDHILRQVDEVNRHRKRKPLRVIFFGDVMQLPPVVKLKDDEKVAELWQERYGQNVFFFNSPEYKNRYRKTIELYDVYRQENPEFKNMLNTIRMGKISKSMMDTLNSHVIDEKVFMKENGDKGVMYLASTNKKVNELNERYEQSFRDMLVPYIKHEALFSGDVDPSDFPTVPLEVSLFLGEQVICTANDDSGENNYQNGTIGTIVDFHNKLPVVKTSDGRVFKVHRHVFTKYRLVDTHDGIKSEKAGSVDMIACKPAFAVTFHKAQGLTLDAAYLDFSGWIAPGSVYLGLSRLRTIDGLGLMKPLTPGTISTNKEALQFFCEERDSIPGDLF